jgi:hypothetical protein
MSEKVTTLYIEKHLESKREECDLCGRTKECVIWKRKAFFTEIQTELNWLCNEKITGRLIKEKEIEVAVCADCARQIAKQLIK